MGSRLLQVFGFGFNRVTVVKSIKRRIPVPTLHRVVATQLSLYQLLYGSHGTSVKVVV